MLDFINGIPAEVKELHVFSDACAGQNRNHTLTRLLMTLTMNGRFSVIHQYYPIRGHSFLPCDRNFSVVKRAVKRLDRIYSPQEYEEIVKGAKKRQPHFQVKRIENEDILNFKDWWPKHFKKTCKDIEKHNVNFNLSKYRYLQYNGQFAGYIKVSAFIGGMIFETFKLKKGASIVVMPTDKAYNSKIPINSKKIEDIRKVLHYIPDEFKEFYNGALEGPTSTNAESDENDE